MTVSCNTLVRNLVLRSFISGSIDVTGKPSFLKAFFPVKEKEHSLIYTIVGKMVSAVRTEDNNIFAAPLQKAVGYRMAYCLVGGLSYLHSKFGLTNRSVQSK